mgnify:CR=1 FL=1
MRSEYCGDGCFRMNMNEIATAVRSQIPVIEVILNNHVLGMVRQWQDLFYEKRYSATVLNDQVDFVKLAEAMGAKAFRASTREEFVQIFEKARGLNEPVLIDCQIDCDRKSMADGCSRERRLIRYLMRGFSRK